MPPQNGRARSDARREDRRLGRKCVPWGRRWHSDRPFLAREGEASMRKLMLAAAAAAIIVSAGGLRAGRAAPAAAPDFAAAVAAPGRPADQVKLDAVRHPAE